MKVLLVGNHTCGNRGDAAILRGIISSLLVAKPDIELDVMSRFPISSSYLLGIDVLKDPLKPDNSGGIKRKLVNKIYSFFLPSIFISKIESCGIFRLFNLPKKYINFYENLKQYDAVIQVGGSFFVDLYGDRQFDHILCALLAKKPIYLVGHSVGPFKVKSFKKLANYCFSKINHLILRETVSRDLMLEECLPMEKVSLGVDTAFLVEPERYEDIQGSIINHWQSIIAKKNTIAITLRKLAPFDKRLGISQEQYEKAFAYIINDLLAQGYQIVVFSTCTGIDSYNHDDRMIALSLSKYVNNDNFHIVMDEINDVQLGALLRRCILTVGTRLHSTIISMNFGTPAIAINYEHKSLGVMKELGLDSYAVAVDDLFNGRLLGKIYSSLTMIDSLKLSVKDKVIIAKNKGHENINMILADIEGRGL